MFANIFSLISLKAMYILIENIHHTKGKKYSKDGCIPSDAEN